MDYDGHFLLGAIVAAALVIISGAEHVLQVGR